MHLSKIYGHISFTIHSLLGMVGFPPLPSLGTTKGKVLSATAYIFKIIKQLDKVC